MTRGTKGAAGDALPPEPGATRAELERRIATLEADVVTALMAGQPTREIRERIAELQFDLAEFLNGESLAITERILRSAGEAEQRRNELSAASTARLRHLLDDLAPPPAPSLA